MAARAQNFVCQSCGAASPRWAGRCEACGAWNTLVEEGAAAPARSRAQGPPVRHRAAQGANARSTAVGLGHGGVRPRYRRRAGARLGAAARRRSGHRQVDAAARGRGRVRARKSPRGLYFRRRSGRAGAAARRTARPRRRRGRACRRDLGRRHHRDALARDRSAPSRHRFDPNHVDAGGRSRARHGHAGARRPQANSSASPSARARP